MKNRLANFSNTSSLLFCIQAALRSICSGWTKLFSLGFFRVLSPMDISLRMAAYIFTQVVIGFLFLNLKRTHSCMDIFFSINRVIFFYFIFTKHKIVGAPFFGSRGITFFDKLSMNVMIVVNDCNLFPCYRCVEIKNYPFRSVC